MGWRKHPDPSDPDALSLIAYLEDTGCVITHTAIAATLTQAAAIAQFSAANNGAPVDCLADLLQSSPVIFHEGRSSLLHRQLQQEDYDHPSLSSFYVAVGNTPSRNPIASPPTWLLSQATASTRPLPSTQPSSRLGLAWIHLMMASCLSTQCSHLHAPSGLPSPVDTLRCHLCPLRPGFSWSLRLCYTTTKHSISEEESTTYTTSRGSATGITESCHRSWGVRFG
eukprot:scaffold1836_cov204-Alexandrium_tamarense.AAC.48